MILASHGIIGSSIEQEPVFVFSIKTDNAGVSTSTQFRMPLTTSTGLNIDVDWGDGSAIENITVHTNAIHTYAAAGTYNVKVTGSLLGWQFANGGDRLKMLNVTSWGVFNISVASGFQGCTNLTCTATDAPLITSTSLASYFRSCPNFNGAIGNWDVSSVTNMSIMFSGASSFNADISTKTINAGQPNEYIAWDVSSVISMNTMFSGAAAFNQNIGNWDTSSVITTGFVGMFSGASSFNADISTKTINAGQPNEYIAWDVSSVISMNTMFSGAAAFNQNIGNWDTSSVITMVETFRNAINFNGNIGNWNTSLVTGMTGMLNNADAFNQDISSWDINQVENFSSFMLNATGLSTANYDLLLVGWEANLEALYPSGVGYPYAGTINISFGGSEYTLLSAAETARASLVSNFGWTISDGGGI